MSDRRTAAQLVALALLLRFTGAICLGAEVADLPGYRRMAEKFLAGENVYEQRIFFPYTPLTLPLPAASLLLAKQTGLPFHLAIKLWPIAADAALTLLVFGSARRLGWDQRAALAAGLAYAANPVAILTSALHGNHTVLAVLASFGAYVLLERADGSSRDKAAALLLGLGIAARSFPVLLVPVFAILLRAPGGPATLARRLRFVAIAGLPTVLASIPALATNADAYLRELFGYSGFTDQGWLAIRRAWGVVTGTALAHGNTAHPIATSKLFFFAAYGAFLALLWRRRQRVDLATGCLLGWLIFLVVYGGISSQYLVWVLPFGLLVSLRWSLAYSLASALAMAAFYRTWFPGVLLGPRAAPAPSGGVPEEWPFYLAALVASWLVSTTWLGFELWKVATARERQPNPPRVSTPGRPEAMSHLAPHR